MARPIKKGLDYYPLNVDFLQDIKVRKIMRACGVQSITILISLLSSIYRDEGYYVVWDSDMTFLVADEVGASEGAVLEVVRKAVQVDFFSEDEGKKGMDISQLTGSTSSYARKYALNGLFAIDDTKDSDYTNKSQDKKIEAKKSDSKPDTKALSEAQIKRLYAIANSAGISADTVKEQVKSKFKKDVKDLTKTEYDKVCNGYENLQKAKE